MSASLSFGFFSPAGSEAVDFAQTAMRLGSPISRITLWNPTGWRELEPPPTIDEAWLLEQVEATRAAGTALRVGAVVALPPFDRKVPVELTFHGDRFAGGSVRSGPRPLEDRSSIC